MVRDFGGWFVAYAYWAATCFGFLVVFVVCAGIDFQGTVFGGRAHTDVFDVGTLAGV